MGIQFLGSRSALLGVGSIALNDLIHVADSVVDLRNTVTLFSRSFRHTRHEIIYLAGFLENIRKRFGHFSANLDPLATLENRVLDFCGSLFSGLSAPLCEVAHLIGYHGESHPSVACTCRLNRGVQSQDVGLEGNFINRLDDLGNVVAGTLDRGHRDIHPLHVAGTTVCSFPGLLSQIVCRAGTFRVALGHG